MLILSLNQARQYNLRLPRTSSFTSVLSVGHPMLNSISRWHVHLCHPLFVYYIIHSSVLWIYRPLQSVWYVACHRYLCVCVVMHAHARVNHRLCIAYTACAAPCAFAYLCAGEWWCIIPPSHPSVTFQWWYIILLPLLPPTTGSAQIQDPGAALPRTWDWRARDGWVGCSRLRHYVCDCNRSQPLPWRCNVPL